jgi:hypothetical protein
MTDLTQQLLEKTITHASGKPTVGEGAGHSQVSCPLVARLGTELWAAWAEPGGSLCVTLSPCVPSRKPLACGALLRFCVPRSAFGETGRRQKWVVLRRQWQRWSLLRTSSRPWATAPRRLFVRTHAPFPAFLFEVVAAVGVCAWHRPLGLAPTSLFSSP